MEESSFDDMHGDEGFAAASSVLRSETWQRELVRGECKDISDETKKQILLRLLGMKVGNKLPWGAQFKVAQEFGVAKGTISKIMKKFETQKAHGESIDVSSKRKGKCGRKPVYSNSEEWLGSAPLHLRGSYRAYAGAINCSHMHIFRLLKKGIIRAHTSPNHPNVSEENMIQRMKWVLSHIEEGSETSKPRFVDMKHTIHIDEKWFYLNPVTRRFYMLPAEIDPYRTTKSKNYSIKIIFMGVVSKPLYNEQGEMVHDGKFGIFPFVVKERAKHSSKNRPAGTLETKPIMKVDTEVIREMMLTKVLPSIKQSWPEGLPKDIIIQQDNARPHLSNMDPQFRAAASSDGFNIHLVNQPPQSPDFNVLDLGLFRALQSLQYQSFPTDIDDLIQKVEQVYRDFDPILIKYVFITLQCVMVEALKVKGSNKYKIPHIGKARLERMGQLPERLQVDQEVIDEAVAYLDNLPNGHNGHGSQDNIVQNVQDTQQQQLNFVEDSTQQDMEIDME